MKILIIGQVPKEYGGGYTTGVGNVIINLCFEFVKKNHDVLVIATNYKGREIRHINKNFKIVGVRKVEISKIIFRAFLSIVGVSKSFINYMSYGINPFKNIYLQLYFSFIFEEFEPDLIHVHNIINLPPTQNAVKNKKPIVLTFHGFFLNNPYSLHEGRKRGVDFVKLYEVARQVKNITVLTPGMEIEVMNFLNKINDIRIDIIPNGASPNFFYSHNHSNYIFNEFNLSKECLKFISVGALTRRKNHKGAIEFLRNNFDDFFYLIIGKEGDYSEELLNVINDDKRIEVMSYVENSELYKYYSSADYFLLPSTKEGQALVTLEAMCCGLPVIVNKAIFDSLGEVEEFESFIQKIDLMDDNFEINNSLNSRLKLKYSKKAQRSFSWEKSALSYLNLYKKIIFKENEN